MSSGTLTWEKNREYKMFHSVEKSEKLLVWEREEYIALVREGGENKMFL